MSADHQPHSETTNLGTFALKDCALIAIATDTRALTLRELADGLAAIDPDSVYYHFWGGLLHPRFEEREYNNDFAAWVRHGLHDPVLAERLAVIDPTDFSELDGVRGRVLELVEERLDENEALGWTRATRQFEFVRSQIVVFDTHRRVERPEELAELIPHLSTGSLFYHFIDARRRSAEHMDDFRAWLAPFRGRCEALCDALCGIDPYFGSLTEVRDQMAAVFGKVFTEGSQ
jgi:hypothetical protein